jgi:hypothetical protein
MTTKWNGYFLLLSFVSNRLDKLYIKTFEHIDFFTSAHERHIHTTILLFNKTDRWDISFISHTKSSTLFQEKGKKKQGKIFFSFFKTKINISIKSKTCID